MIENNDRYTIDLILLLNYSRIIFYLNGNMCVCSFEGIVKYIIFHLGLINIYFYLFYILELSSQFAIFYYLTYKFPSKLDGVVEWNFQVFAWKTKSMILSTFVSIFLPWNWCWRFRYKYILPKKRFTGKSKWPFYFKLNNYRHRIKSIDCSKLVEQHFHSNDHDLNRDAGFTIIERTGWLVV